jgi:2-oxoglutarate ferredoxin oxidoreductase subunit delta
VSKENLVLRLNRVSCKGCGICVAFCPTKVLKIVEDNKCKIIDLEKCIKCGQCELRCPDYAIYLEEGTDGK